MASPEPIGYDSLCEKRELNQYWYSPGTAQALISELEAGGALRCAFLSTPSVFCALPEASPLRAGSVVFDLDNAQFGDSGAFVHYDYRAPEALPLELHGSFDAALIDPPFVVEEVVRSYAAAARLLLAAGGKILFSTIPENAAVLQELLGLQPRSFKPCCPTLVYQFSFFSNFECGHLSQPNPELGEDDD